MLILRYAVQSETYSSILSYYTHLTVTVTAKGGASFKNKVLGNCLCFFGFVKHFELFIDK